MSTTEMPEAEAIAHALRAATRAPSPHNTQPWRFQVSSRHVDVLLDRDRLLMVADPDARGARLACGAAVFNLRTALHAAGRASRLDLLPDAGRPELVATVWLGGRHAPSPEQLTLAAAIERRASNRRPFLDRSVPVPARQALLRAADIEGGRLVLLDQPSQLATFAAMLRRADHLQAEDPAFQAELLRWMSDHADRDDGVPRSAGGPRPTGVLALRTYTSHGSVEDRPFEQDPLVMVVAMHGDTAADQLRAGQVLQRVLLTATVNGLSSSFVSQPMELAHTRAALRELLGGRLYPQTALRIGYGYTVPQTRRRDLDTVADTVAPRGEG